jgi:hypothetical protein
VSWWTARTERTITADVPATPDRVRAFYVDLDSLKVVHPLIVSVQELSRTEEPDGYRQTSRVVDVVRIGPVRMRISYVTRLHVPLAGDVHTEADQSPGVRLRGTVSFTEIPGGTRITERIRIAAPRPLAGYTVREAVKAHDAMLAGIRAHFS